MSEAKPQTEALAKKEASTPLAKVRGLLNEDAYKRRFEAVLREKAPQFMASITNLVAQEYQLQQCKPESVIAAAFVAACLDLPIDKSLGYAWIVPYKDMATFIIGWKGYVQLALRTGLYKSINAFPVNAEALGPIDEVGERTIHYDKLDLEGLESGKKPAVGYCCAWKLTTGFVKICYWSKEQVDAHAKKYSAAVKANKQNSPWFTETDKMRLKTVVANSLRKWGIMSIETRQMQIAVQHDQMAQPYIDAEPIYPELPEGEVEEPTNGKDKANALAERLKSEKPGQPTPESQPAATKKQEIVFPESQPAQDKPEAAATDESPTGLRGRLEDAYLACGEALGKQKAKDVLELATGKVKLASVADDKVQAGIDALVAAARKG